MLRTILPVSRVGAAHGVDRRHTSGSPHGGSLYIGLLFHCGGGSVIVKFEGMLIDYE